jgi:hypothetical protein
LAGHFYRTREFATRFWTEEEFESLRAKMGGHGLDGGDAAESEQG